MSAIGSAWRKAHRVLDRISSNERRVRAASFLASATLIGALAGAGHAIAPWPGKGGEGHLYRAADAAALRLPAAEAIPVFVLEPGRRVVRSAVAEATGDGAVRIAFFESAEAAVPAASEVLLFQPGLTVLWAAAPEASRKALRDRVAAVQDAAARAIEGILASRVVAEEYGPALRDILGEAVTRAWERDRTQAALASLIKRAQPQIGEALRGEAGDILRDHLRRAVWDMLDANWTKVFGVLVGYELDYAPVNAAVAAAFRDPRVQGAVMRLGTDLIETPEAARLIEQLAIGIVNGLVRDPRVAPLVTRMFGDTALRAEVQPLSQALFTLAGALPRDLGGLGRESDLNPLVAHVFKALTLNTGTPLILFVTPEDRARIEASNPGAAVHLLRAGRGGKA